MPPYQYDPYVNRHVGSIAEMMQRAGEIRAQQAMQVANAQARATQASGDVWGQAIGNIGQSIAAIPQQMMQQKRIDAEAQQDAMRTKVMQGQIAGQQAEAATRAGRADAMKRTSRAEVLEALKTDPEGQKLALEQFKLIDDNFNRTLGTAAAGVRKFKDNPQAAIAALDDLMDKGFDEKRMTQLRMQILERPEAVSQLVDALLAKSPDKEHHDLMTPAQKATEGFTLGEGQQRFDAQGNVVASVPKPEKPETEPNRTEAQLAYMAEKDPAAARALARLRALREKPASDSEPLVPIMGPDGPVLVRRSQAEGKRPASGREQGRAVTSGDAGRIADLDTSLNDLATLRTTLTETKGATGTSAAIGAGLPAAITDLTGWGTEAKKRQGVIDRVKQVIGKALEGGVLRKEDEIKYEKILPNIKDTAEVAASKLNGLAAALKQRRQTTIEALADAGYDTAKFEARTPAAPTEVKVGGFTVKVKP